LLFYLRPYDLGVFLAFVTLCALAAAVLFGRSLVIRGVDRKATVLLISTAFLTSYPLWYELKQANMEIFVWCLVATGIWCFLSGRGSVAAVCFGVAGAMKIFPFVYLGLFLARKQYRQFALSLAVSVLVTIPALWLVYPHIPESWRLTNAAVAQFGPLESLQIHPETGSDHSVFALIKCGVRLLFAHPLSSRLLTAYLATAAVGGLALYIFLIRKAPIINQVLCLCVASISLAPTSFDYTLMHLYVPWALLILFAERPENAHRYVPGLRAAFCCFAVLFAPESEIILYAHSFGGQFKCLVLIALFVIGLIYPFDNEVLQHRQVRCYTAIDPCVPRSA
jgi:hypothetical protein